MSNQTHIEHSVSSHIIIAASPEIIWEHITRVQIDNFDHPWYLSLLQIPKPLSAKITKKEAGGRRIAYFDNGKKFIQEILTWNKPLTYSFSFKAEKDFRVGYFFYLREGPFRMQSGKYELQPIPEGTKLYLRSCYSIAKSMNWLLNWPIYGVLRLFQRYLLTSIKKNAESDVNTDS